MPNNILDRPLDYHPKIRKPYFFVIEFLIIITNVIAILVGIGSSWYNAFHSGADWFFFFLIPPIFILLFGITPILYMLRWRKASRNYEQSKDKEGFKKLSTELIAFVHPVMGVMLTLILFITCIALYSTFNKNDDWPVILIVVVIFVFPIFVLGPMQYLFIRYIRKIAKQFNETT